MKNQKKQQPFFPYIQNPHFSTMIPQKEQTFKENEIKCLPREVLKWIQSLDLTYSIKNYRKDFCNGFLIAQIFSRYYPEHFPMHTIENGFSSSCRRNNWTLIKKYLELGFVNVNKKITEQGLKLEYVEHFCVETNQSNNDILLYLLKMFQELTRRKLELLDYKKFQTDTDNVNKSFFLKENGEVEPLKKDEEGDTEKQNISDITLQQKSNNISIFFIKKLNQI